MFCAIHLREPFKCFFEWHNAHFQFLSVVNRRLWHEGEFPALTLWQSSTSCIESDTHMDAPAAQPTCTVAVPRHTWLPSQLSLDHWGEPSRPLTNTCVLLTNQESVLSCVSSWKWRLVFASHSPLLLLVTLPNICIAVLHSTGYATSQVTGN